MVFNTDRSNVVVLVFALPLGVIGRLYFVIVALLGHLQNYSGTSIIQTSIFKVLNNSKSF